MQIPATLASYHLDPSVHPYGIGRTGGRIVAGARSEELPRSARSPATAFCFALSKA